MTIKIISNKKDISNLALLLINDDTADLDQSEISDMLFTFMLKRGIISDGADDSEAINAFVDNINHINLKYDQVQTAFEQWFEDNPANDLFENIADIIRPLKYR